MMQEEITESELNSEVELLNSQDLLRKVVLANGLQARWRSWLSLFGKPSEEVEIAKAVRQLGKHLKVEPLRKTNMISVSLESSDPELAARVLNSLGSLYLGETSSGASALQASSHSSTRKPTQLRRGLDTAEGRLNRLHP